MTCASCGASAHPGARFCQECGARIESSCPACGAAVTPDQRFCAECGARLPAAGSTPGADPAGGVQRHASPSGYTPPHLAERILKDRAALEGERKQVTVLFADVSGFTSIAQALDPEEVHALMSRAFELMLAEIHRYEGTVNQFLGDGLMALFGAPVAHEDHGRRAALAARGMQAALARYRDELQRERGIDFRVRMGLNTGLVVVGAIGDNLRMDYTAVGDTTNVAARMQQLAEPGRILVAEATWRAIQAEFEWRPLGSVAVKNRAEPVTAWELGAPVPHAPRSRALAPLLGRDDALARLERAVAAVQSGKPQVVYLVGEAGIGKSRLLLELRQRLGGTMSWVEGRCVSYGQSTALLPFLEVLRNLLGIEPDDSESQVIDKVRRELAVLGPAAVEFEPYIRFALALDPGDPRVRTMDPKERLGILLEGVQQLFYPRAGHKRGVLVIEDLHWIDSASERYLTRIIDDLGGKPTLVILTWRPSYRPPFNEHTYVSRLVLDALEDEDALRLVRVALGIDNVPDELAGVIARKAEGNPFFLEEIGRALLETGAVRAENSRLTLTRPASTIVVPDRIQDVIAARIDRLKEDQKRTVQVAAVIGREFALRLLRRVTDGAARVEQALGELKALELVYERLAAADLEYVFKHALTQDVAYESILHARRRELHARIGAAIEEVYANRLEERVDELTYHFTRGEVWDKAARYALQAGDRAAGFCLDDKAVEFYEQALAALARLPETMETARLGIDVRLALRAPLWRGGQLDRLFGVFKEVEALATAHGEQHRLDTVYAFFLQYHWAKGEQPEAIRYGQRCLEAAARRDDLGLRVTAHYYLGWSYFVRGEFQRCLEHQRAILDLLEGPLATERFGLSGLPYCGACTHAAWCLVELGDLPGAFEYLDRGDLVAIATGHLYSTVPLSTVRSRALLQESRVDEALRLAEHVVGVCREKKFVGQLMLALTVLSQAYARQARHEEAIATAHEGVKVKDAARAPVIRGYHLVGVAEAYLAAGRLDEAASFAQEAIEWSQRLGERAFEAYARATLGEITGRRGDHATARRHLQDALAIAAALGMGPLGERCRKLAQLA